MIRARASTWLDAGARDADLAALGVDSSVTDEELRRISEADTVICGTPGALILGRRELSVEEWAQKNRPPEASN